MPRIATWNVNSVKARLGMVAGWLKSTKPDVCLIQEIKCQDADFPRLELEELGYNIETVGQKSYNGVAILSRHPMSVEARRLPGDKADEQARYLEAIIELPGKNGRQPIRVASIYLPNGNPAPGEKFDYKLAWMRRLIAHAQKLLTQEEILVLGGDYNVCPTDRDVYDPAAFAEDALCRPESRALFRELTFLGLTDGLRALHSRAGLYSYWDYQAGAWAKDHGLRIDHLLLSPQAADRLSESGVDKKPRAQEKPSDHTPVWCELDL